MSKISKRIAVFTLAAAGLAYTASYIGAEAERNSLNNEYQNLHDNFFAQSTPLFSQIDWDSERGFQCIQAIEETRRTFIVTSLERISHLSSTDTVVPREMIQAHIKQIKPSLGQYQESCKPYLPGPSV